MANTEVHIPKGKVLCGFNVALEIPVISKTTKLPQSLAGWGLEWQIRDKPEDAAPALTKTTVAGQITLATSELAVANSVTNDIAVVAIAPNDTAASGSGAPSLNGMYYHTLFRTGSGTKVAIASGTIWITPAGGR